MISEPKFKVNQTVQIVGSRYSFRIDEIIYEGIWRYRGQMFKDGRSYSYGTVTERVLI